jgi:hypothetical protein
LTAGRHSRKIGQSDFQFRRWATALTGGRAEMYRASCAALAIAALLAGCDDADIRGVGRRQIVTQKHLIEIFSASSLQVEVHGVPWDGATPDEIAGTLRMPEGDARELRFRAVAPGDPVIGDGERLVLRFNPGGDVARDDICRAGEPMPSDPPRSGRFTVDATFCRGRDWLTHAQMEATVDATDWLNYYLVMETLLGRMFPAK